MKILRSCSAALVILVLSVTQVLGFFNGRKQAPKSLARNRKMDLIKTWN